jgi:MGT family glycosyltransferase
MADPRRFLMLTLDAAGNWPPERALLRALAARGHTVRVLSGEVHAKEIAAAGCEFRPYRFVPQRNPRAPRDDPQENEQERVWRDTFVNPQYGDELLAEVEREAPDVLLVDQMLLAGAAAAESTKLPAALLWHTVFGARVGRRAVTAAMWEPLDGARQKLGLPRVADLRTVVGEAEALLAFTYEAFDEALVKRPPQLHYVGPLACLPQPQPNYVAPWDADDPRPLVLVSYSTSFQYQVPTLQRVADALAGLPVRALFTLGSAVSPEELRLPDNAVAERFVPHAALLPRTHLLVTHAGHGTVMAGVSAGVPLLCTPMGRDQFSVAACVERLGLGRVVPMTASAEELRAELGAALGDGALRERSRSFAAGLDLQAGLRRALEVLEGLAGA